MPKAGKGRAARKEEVKKTAAPYSREKPTSAGSSAPLNTNDDRKAGRKRRKSKGQNVTAGDIIMQSKNESDQEETVADAAEATTEPVDAEDELHQKSSETSTSELTLVAPTQSTKNNKSKKDKKEKKPSEEPASPEPKKRKTKHELRELQARFQEAQVAADAAQAELQKKIAELEKTVADQAAQLETKSTTIDNTNKLLASMDEHRSAVKEALSCGICMDVIDEPHALQCGHTACRTCLLQWFRSPTAYPAPDVENIQPEDDLTYRTKQCHLCRENVYIRPVRVFAVASIAEAIGLTRTKSSPAANKIEGAPAVAKSDVDLWAKTFPPDTTSYVTWDDADSVWRCPKCGSEVANGDCQGCHAVFSDADLDDDESGDEDSDDSILSGDESDMEPEVYRHVIRTALPARRPARDSDDDSPYASHLLNALDLLADEASDDEGSHGDDWDSDHSGRGSQESSPALTSTPTLYPRRDRELYPDDEDLEAAGEEDYESSFIADSDSEGGDPGSESEVDLSAAGFGVEGGSDNEIEDRRRRHWRHEASSRRGGSRVLDEESDDGIEVVDAPTVDELRARRAARFGSGAAQPQQSQPVHRRTRRVIDISDDE